MDGCQRQTLLVNGSTIPTSWRLSADCRALRKQSGSACSTLTQFEFGPVLVVFQRLELTEDLRVLPLKKLATILQFRLKISLWRRDQHDWSSWLVVFLFIGLEVKGVVDLCQLACYHCWLHYTEASPLTRATGERCFHTHQFTHVCIDQLSMYRTCEANSPLRLCRQFSPCAPGMSPVLPCGDAHRHLRTPGSSTPRSPSCSSTKETSVFKFPHESFKVDILGNSKFHQQPSSPCRPSRRFLHAWPQRCNALRHALAKEHGDVARN